MGPSHSRRAAFGTRELTWAEVIAFCTMFLTSVLVPLLLIAFLTSYASAHDIYTGIKNKSGYDCCDGQHCHPLSASRVKSYDTGYKRGYRIDNFFWVDEDRV